MGFLGCFIAHLCGLLFGSKPAKIGKAGLIIGGNQLGIAVDWNNAFRVLLSNPAGLPADEAKPLWSVGILRAVVLNKG